MDVALKRINNIEKSGIKNNCDMGVKVFRVADTNIKWNTYRILQGFLTDNRIEFNPQKVCIYKLSGDFFIELLY